MTAAAITLPTAGGGKLLAIFRVIAFVPWTLGALITRLIVWPLGIQTAPLRVAYYRGLCKILGIEVVTHGLPQTQRPLLIASNHISYLDIIAYGAVAELEFVSKAEVAQWPVIGGLAKLADTVFIDRRRSKALAARQDMAHRLNADRMLLFFPEATSGDGNRPLPFKSALFTVADAMNGEKKVMIQPSVIAYTRLNGLPTGVGWRSFFAWYGDISLSSHVWRFLQLGRTTIEIAFLPPLLMSENMDRRSIAQTTELAVRSGFARLVSGRPLA